MNLSAIMRTVKMASRDFDPYLSSKIDKMKTNFGGFRHSFAIGSCLTLGPSKNFIWTVIHRVAIQSFGAHVNKSWVS